MVNQLIRAVCQRISWLLTYYMYLWKYLQCRSWSIWMDAKADLGLCWLYTTECIVSFCLVRPIFLFLQKIPERIVIVYKLLFKLVLKIKCLFLFSLVFIYLFFFFFSNTYFLSVSFANKLSKFHKSYLKKSFFLLFFNLLRNVYCGYSLEMPQQGLGSHHENIPIKFWPP